MAHVTKGILGRKVGMTQIFDASSRVIPVTVVAAGPCRISAVRTPERDGYSAVQLAYDEVPERKLNQPERGHLKKASLPPMRTLAELRLESTDGFEVGKEVLADVFAKGERVDVIGTSKGKGFSGVMRRHGFRGLSASHGTERKHRSPGSVGASATPSRIFRGMKMAGQLGNARVTTLNLEVVDADPARNLLLIRGAVPGPNGSIVMVRSSVKARSNGGAQKS
ncbi:MAG TPA: 50S ribosomal protein L3 [Actinomycetota bacterium]|nr:50S ribosomal protein L3 [Actinomycetota bacterium]